MKQANTYEEIKPLIELCKAGKLFAVQEWIAAEKPVNLPGIKEKTRRKSPLEIAIECGFHSLVQVLLEGGAAVEEPRYNPLLHALWKRRLDFVELLVAHGAKIQSVRMDEVFDTWDRGIIDFFIDQGADLEKDEPLAGALCSRIRPALGIYKQYQDRFPTFPEQLNIALRHHCKEGNVKWVSLLLWAGADPYVRGDDGTGETDPEEQMSAIELAILYGRFDLFKIKGMRLDPSHPLASSLLRKACWNEKPDILKRLLDNGFKPSNLEDQGSSLIQSLINGIDWELSPYYGYRSPKNDVDHWRGRDKLKMIHMVVRHGAKWQPEQYELNKARRSLLKMRCDYTMEFVWILTEYRACGRETVEKLLAGPKMRALLSNHKKRLDEIIKSFGDGLS